MGEFRHYPKIYAYIEQFTPEQKRTIIGLAQVILAEAAKANLDLRFPLKVLLGAAVYTATNIENLHIPMSNFSHKIEVDYLQIVYAIIFISNYIRNRLFRGIKFPD